MEATVFIMRHFEGLSYQEIAEATNSTKNAVGVALHSARRKLMKYLANYLS
jgi:DNA-directed RNA polymerase specialized sigma24 family protein